MDIARALTHAGLTGWSINGNDYESLTMENKPSLEQIAAWWAELEALSYREKRAAEYPTLGDQLDALWKGGQAASDMAARIAAVKAKYPKP